MFCLIQGHTNLSLMQKQSYSTPIIYVICYQYCHLRVKSELGQQTVQQPQVSSASWDLQDIFGIFSASRFCATNVYIQLHYKLCYLNAGLFLRLILTPWISLFSVHSDNKNQCSQKHPHTRQASLSTVMYFCWQRVSYCKASLKIPRYQTAFLFSFRWSGNCCHTFPMILFPMMLMNFLQS